MIMKLFTAAAEATAAATEAVEESAVVADVLEPAAEKGFTFSVPSGLMLIVVVIALIVALIVVASFKSQMKTAHKKSGAAEYALRNTFRLDRQSDIFLYENVQRRPIQQQVPQQAPRQGGNAPKQQ